VPTLEQNDAQQIFHNPWPVPEISYLLQRLSFGETICFGVYTTEYRDPDVAKMWNLKQFSGVANAVEERLDGENIQWRLQSA
jgi:hypothetical protein